MITEQLPYAECRNATQIYKKVQADVPPDALALVPDERAAAFVRLCVRRDPAARPSASELLAHPFLVPDPAFGETEVKLLAPPRTLAPVAERAGASGAPSLDSAGSEDRSSPGRGPDGDRTGRRRRRRRRARFARRRAAAAASSVRVGAVARLVGRARLARAARVAAAAARRGGRDDDAFIANMPSSETSMKDVENRVREGRRRREDDADAAAAAAATAREGRDAKPRRARDASSDSARSRASDARRQGVDRRRRPLARVVGGVARRRGRRDRHGPAGAARAARRFERPGRAAAARRLGDELVVAAADAARRRRGTRRVARVEPRAVARRRSAGPAPGGAPPPRFRMRPSTKPVRRAQRRRRQRQHPLRVRRREPQRGL